MESSLKNRRVKNTGFGSGTTDVGRVGVCDLASGQFAINK